MYILGTDKVHNITQSLCRSLSQRFCSWRLVLQAGERIVTPLSLPCHNIGQHTESGGVCIVENTTCGCKTSYGIFGPVAEFWCKERPGTAGIKNNVVQYINIIHLKCSCDVCYLMNINNFLFTQVDLVLDKADLASMLFINGYQLIEYTLSEDPKILSRKSQARNLATGPYV